MLNITSIKSSKKEKLGNYMITITYKSTLDSAAMFLADGVVQGVSSEYFYTHDCSAIAIGEGSTFWNYSLNGHFTAYKYRSNLSALEDLAEHIKFLVNDVEHIEIREI